MPVVPVPVVVTVTAPVLLVCAESRVDDVATAFTFRAPAGVRATAAIVNALLVPSATSPTWQLTNWLMRRQPLPVTDLKLRPGTGLTCTHTSRAEPDDDDVVTLIDVS